HRKTIPSGPFRHCVGKKYGQVQTLIITYGNNRLKADKDKSNLNKSWQTVSIAVSINNVRPKTRMLETVIIYFQQCLAGFRHVLYKKSL
ncbi:MAG: hypothetical protein ACXV8Q_20380, partial [Methylobacter sp.]